MKHVLIPILGAALLAGCDSQTDGYPRLLPTQQILAEPALPDHAPEAATSSAATDAEAAARAAELRRRADALRGPVIEPEVKSRIQAAAPDLNS